MSLALMNIRPKLIRENRYVQGYLNFVQAKCAPTGNVKVNKELGQTLY